MASLHNQSYPDHLTFSSEFCQGPPYLVSNQITTDPTGGGLLWKGDDQENFPLFDQTTRYPVDIATPESKCNVNMSSVPPDQLTNFDCTLMSTTTLPENELRYLELCGMDGAHQNYCANNYGGNNHYYRLDQETHEFSRESFMTEFDIFRHASQSQVNCHAGPGGGIQIQSMPLAEDTSMKVGRYSAEERKDRILRYLKKRNQRNFNKTIKYACRKTLADRRVRVRGRFARNNESSDEAGLLTNIPKQETPLLQNDLYFCDAIDHQISMKQEEEVWMMQEAMASLMNLPYIGG